MKTQVRARVARHAAQAACLGVLLSCLPMAQAGQHGGSAPHFSAPAQHSAPQPRPQQSRPQPRNEGRPQQQRPGGNPQARPQPNYAPPRGAMEGARNFSARPAYGGSPYGGAPYAVRPNPQAAGHLPQWMAQHENMPVGQQERLLRQEPGFNRLSPGEQQRQIQQLHQLNQMPEPQRDRRLARAEAFERLSPTEQMQVRQSSSRLGTLPADRQAMVRRAFQDLRGVPMDQRETVLNSARYGATFSPEERGILSNLLRVEPYQGPR